jgi:hypothetical protein
LAAERALAAARCRMLADRLPEAERDDLVRLWTRTLDQVDAARSEGAAELLLIQFREDIEARPEATRPHVPLEEVGR